MIKSSYHNTLQNWIKNNMLVSYEISTKKIKVEYDPSTKTYKGKPQIAKVLLLHFKHTTRYVREQHITDYIDYIKGVEYENN